MLAPTIRLNAATKAERNVVISDFTNAVAEVSGWIEDVNFFSNISIALRFVIPSSSGEALVRLITAQPLEFDTDGILRLNSLAEQPREAEVICSLQITFFHSEPDMHRHIPPVPG